MSTVDPATLASFERTKQKYGSALAALAEGPPPPTSYWDNIPDFVKHPDLDLYHTGVPLYLDFETTNIDKGDPVNPSNRIVLAVWKLGSGPFQHCFGNEFEQQELVDAVGKADYIVAHNAKFELMWLERCGVDISYLVVYDTMLAEYVIGGNRWKFAQLALANIAERRKMGGKIDVVSRMIKQGICPSEIPRSWLLMYCVRDVELLPRLKSRQMADMVGTRLLPVVYARCLLTPVLADMEKEGMQLDPDLVRTRFAQEVKRFEDLETDMNLMTGGLPFTKRKLLAAYVYDTLGFEELKVKRGKEWVPVRTPGGERSTKAEHLAKLSAISSKQIAFIDLYMKLNDQGQLLSKYLRKFNDCVLEAGGHMTANFNQTATFTHRLSSNGKKYRTQFQNMMRTLKSLFKAKRDGYLMGECDGSQLEFRVAAHMGRCAAALSDVASDFDVHKFTASVLNGKAVEDVTKPERQDAKSRTFKPLYGGQSGTAAEQAYYAAFRLRYPGIAQTQERWVYTVLEKKWLETEWGLRYYWPTTKMDRSGYISNTTSICNYPVQAFATAEIIPFGLICMWHILKRTGLRIYLVNTVHDSIVAEVHPDEAEDWHRLSEYCLIDMAYYMVEKVYGIKLIVKLGCEVQLGSHWSVGDGKKYEAPASYYQEVT